MLAQSGPKYNDATGGTITTYTVGSKTWRLHSWETAGSYDFVVTKAINPFRLCYVGAGGGGGGTDGIYQGGGGDGGWGGDVTGITLTAGTTYPIVVGGGSTYTGGNTTALGYTGNGGTYGQDGLYFNRPAGTTRGPTSNIRDGATTVQYGVFGGASGNEPAPGFSYFGKGAGGSYGGGGVIGRVGSYPGAVWIAYEIGG